jgi:hypothetical protein
MTAGGGGSSFSYKIDRKIDAYGHKKDPNAEISELSELSVTNLTFLMQL